METQAMKNQEKEVQKTSNDAAGKEFCRATVIGFSRVNCMKCHGRGRIGFDTRYKDNLHIILCSCVEVMDLETVEKDWEKAKQKKEEAENDQS